MLERNGNTPYIFSSVQESIDKMSSGIKGIEDLAVRDNSGITSKQLKNVLDHMFSSEVSNCPDVFTTGVGRHNLKISAGKAITPLNREIGRSVLNLGYSMCLASGKVIEAIAISRGIMPKEMVDSDIFRRFTFSEPTYDVQGAYETLLNTPFESVKL